MQGASMPRSSTEAIIVPLAKAGDPSEVTNYRPIALLQSSYKILTKILADHVQQSLGKVINADQNGFVRGRALTTNVTLVRAVMEQNTRDDEPSSATENAAVVLLDFKKAYDTLDREFVTTALGDFGYSDAFVSLVRRLHVDTSAQFLVNGELSDPIDIVTGIRQGCPLAPLLFLIAVEPLKHAIDQDASLSGIQLHHRSQQFEHTFSAFVDDSMVFLAQGSMMPALEAVLHRFGELSGLTVQPHKSHVVILNKNCTDEHLGSFPIVPVGETVTYLDVEIGIADLDGANWDKRCHSMQQQLGILSQYTTGVHDRVQIINLACIPSLLFTAQFFTPPRDHRTHIDGLWRQFVWHGTLTRAPRRAQKIAREIVHLPRSSGGLGLRDYRGAMTAQAASAAILWHSRSKDKYWAAYQVLLQTRVNKATEKPVQIHPSATASPDQAIEMEHNLLQIGLDTVNATLSRRYPHPESLRLAKVDLLASISEPWLGVRWLTTHHGELTLRERDIEGWTQLAQLNYAQMPPETKTFWATFPWQTNSWIRGRDGDVLRGSDFPFIRISRLSELELCRVDAITYRFRNPAGAPQSMHNATRHRLAWWLCTIVANLAALPSRPPCTAPHASSVPRDIPSLMPMSGTTPTTTRFEATITATRGSRKTTRLAPPSKQRTSGGASLSVLSLRRQLPHRTWRSSPM